MDSNATTIIIGMLALIIVILGGYSVVVTREAGAKAELSGDGNRGIVYLKYRDLDAVLRIANGKRNLDILRARRQFDDYRVDSD